MLHQKCWKKWKKDENQTSGRGDVGKKDRKAKNHKTELKEKKKDVKVFWGIFMFRRKTKKATGTTLL